MRLKRVLIPSNSGYPPGRYGIEMTIRSLVISVTRKYEICSELKPQPVSEQLENILLGRCGHGQALLKTKVDRLPDPSGTMVIMYSAESICCIRVHTPPDA